MMPGALYCDIRDAAKDLGTFTYLDVYQYLRRNGKEYAQSKVRKTFDSSPRFALPSGKTKAVNVGGKVIQAKVMSYADVPLGSQRRTRDERVAWVVQTFKEPFTCQAVVDRYIDAYGPKTAPLTGTVQNILRRLFKDYERREGYAAKNNGEKYLVVQYVPRGWTDD